MRQMYPGRRVCCVFQPHQASRVKNLLDDEGYANGATAGRRAGATPTFTNPTPGRAGVFGQNTTYELNPPRTYGVEFQYRF